MTKGEKKRSDNILECQNAVICTNGGPGGRTDCTRIITPTGLNREVNTNRAFYAFLLSTL